MSDRNRPSLFGASALYLLASAGLWLVGLILAPQMPALFPGLSTEQLNLLINLCYYLPFLFFPVALWATRRNGALRLNPLPLRLMLMSVLAALICVVLIYDLSVFWMILCQKLGLNVFTDSYIRPANTAELMRSIIAGAVIAPVCEELLFRGAMLSAWESGGTRRAIGVTAMLFAILHGSVVGLPGELIAGLILGALVIWTDSLYAGMAFHTVYNAAVMMLDYMSSAPEAAESAAEVSLMQTDLAAYFGGAELAMLAVEILVLGLMLTFILRIFHMHAYVREIQRTLAPDGSPEKMMEAARRIPEGGTLLDQERSDQLRRGDFIPRAPLSPSAGTVLVIMAGVVSSLGLYVFDLLSMLGG